MLKGKGSRFISAERSDFISELAEEVALASLRGESISPEAVANKYSLTYSYGRYKDAFDGLLWPLNGSFHIYINLDRNQNQNRQRFSFGHELGHFFIDEHRTALLSGHSLMHQSSSGFASTNPVEREADYFAACLLLPKSLVINDYRKFRKFEFRIVEQIGQKYGVSLLASILRLFHLDLHPMMIVGADSGAIKWILKSADFWFFPKHGRSQIPSDSMMYEYFQNWVKHKKTQQVWTGDWFDVKNDTRLYEHCIYHDATKSCVSVLWKD